jgi:hypothetical protein
MMNWVERAAVSPGLDPALTRTIQRFKREQRWTVYDASIAMVKVRVSPENADVIVDDTLLLPRRSRYRVWLKAGSHQLTVSAPGHEVVDQVFSSNVSETRTVSVRLRATRKPELLLSVRQRGARLWVNRHFKGIVSNRPVRLEPGVSIVEIRAQGYLPWVKQYRLPAGKRVTEEVELSRLNVGEVMMRRASQVDRRLTPLELNDMRDARGRRSIRGGRRASRSSHPLRMARGDNSTLSSATRHGRDRDSEPASKSYEAGERPQLSGTTRREQVEEAPQAAPEPAGMEPQEEPDELEPERGVPQADATVVESSGGSGGSSVLKGWLWTGLGLVITGAGIGTSLMGIQTARDANDLKVGTKGYGTYYDYAEQLTYIGYAGSAVGIASIGVGSLYLFGGNGLSVTGKGLLLTTMGVMTGATGGYLLVSGAAQADAANALSPSDPNYAVNYEGAEGTWRAGAIAAGLGALVASTGLYVVFARTGRSAANDSEAPLWRRTVVLPSISRDRLGASLMLGW